LQKLRKNLLRSLSLLLLWGTSACSNLSSIDKPVCVRISAEKGYCTTIISGQDIIVDDQNKLNGKTWFEMSPEMILVPIDTWAAIKKYLILNCRRYKKCNVQIDSWDRSLQKLEGKVEDK
jgi:hypothetical protein